MIDVGLDASDSVSARAIFGDRAVSDNLETAVSDSL
jgi:hypothetical protein